MPTTWEQDEEAYVKLFDSVVRDGMAPIVRYARPRVADADELDDVIQTTLIFGWQNRHQLRDRACLQSWLMSICRGVLSRERRHALQRAQLAKTQESCDSESGSIEVALEDQRRFDARLRLIVDLPPEQRAVVFNRLLRGRSVRETATLLGKSEGTVKATLNQVRQKLLRVDRQLGADGGKAAV